MGGVLTRRAHLSGLVPDVSYFDLMNPEVDDIVVKKNGGTTDQVDFDNKLMDVVIARLSFGGNSKYAFLKNILTYGHPYA